MELFKLPKEDYKRNVDPINHYIDQSSYYISKKMNISVDKAKDLVKQTLKNYPNKKNPTVVFRERTIDGTIQDNEKMSLVGYLNYVTQENDIIAPSGTVYFNPKKKKSLHAEFIDVNVKERSKHKKLAFKYKMEKNWEKFNYHNTLQKSMKIFNNSLSGAYASASTVLYNPSAHYTLTSVTRCMSGIGNAYSENMIAGNRHYKDSIVLLGHLISIIKTVDLNKIDSAISKYNLHIPTTEEIMNNVVIKNIEMYWRDNKKELEIYKFIQKLDYREKVAITYVNDLFNLRVFNNQFVKDVIDEFLNPINYNISDSISILNNAPEGIINLLLHVESELMLGKKYILSGDDKLPDDIINKLANTTKHLINMFSKYNDLIKAFFITEIFPVSIAHIKDMTREVIVLSDTDSTCATYQNWVEWYYGKMIFGPKSTAISAIIMTMVSEGIDHYVKLFGANMNIGLAGAKYLSLKNEFFWDVFVNTDVSKHYFANVRIQEGNVYEIPDLEKKGVHLIASNAYDKIRNLAEEIMKSIMSTIGKNKKIKISNYLNKVADAEKMIMDKVLKGSPDVLKLEKIKEAKAYKAEPDKSPFLQYVLWQKVFSFKYGNAPDPTYMAIKIPATINNKTDMNNFIENIGDTDLKNNFKEFLKEFGKTEIKTFKLPLINIFSNGIPKELIPIIDVDRVVKDNCNVLYMVLASLGFYLKPNMKVIDYLKDNDIHKYNIGAIEKK